MNKHRLRGQYLRWAYAFGMLIVGSFITLLSLADDEVGSHDNSGVWITLGGMAALFVFGFVFALPMHRWFERIMGRNVKSRVSGKRRSSR